MVLEANLPLTNLKGWYAVHFGTGYTPRYWSKFAPGWVDEFDASHCIVSMLDSLVADLENLGGMVHCDLYLDWEDAVADAPEAPGDGT
jgi:hypothetical protein